MTHTTVRPEKTMRTTELSVDAETIEKLSEMDVHERDVWAREKIDNSTAVVLSMEFTAAPEEQINGTVEVGYL